jgi:RNA-directed DNA polymerase
MTERMPTRAELMARIAASSKDAVVLAEMQRLGYWPKDAAQPTIEAALLSREAELQQALFRLQGELHVQGDPQAALAAMRRERMALSLEQREAKAQARERQRYERALRWHEARKTEAGYLGEGVSGGLTAEIDPEAVKARLQSAGLPAISTPLELAQAMGLSLPELKFLCFHREVARTTHYRRFALPKKTGGVRTISAPMPRLKRAQYWVLDQLLAKVPVHAAAHGFLPGRSIVSNAEPHCGQDVVINLDLKDFFPGIHFPRIKGVFCGLGYSQTVASLLALLCSENACDELTVDGERFFVGGKGHERVLPQGAPTSPMLTNVLCRKLDRRLAGLAAKLGFAYTRYADDLTFSAAGDAAHRVGRLLRQVHHVLRDEGFTPHPDKQRVMRRGARQEVTGVVVNDKPSVSRSERRKLRAALHRASQEGLQAAHWQGETATRDTLVGYARFVHMVNARQGAPLLQRALALTGTSGPGPQADAFRAQAARGLAPARRQGPWWQVATAPDPQLALTAGQMKAARQQRLNAERAARNEARRPSSPPPVPARQTPAAPQAAGDGHPPVLWGRYGAQLLGMALLAVGQQSLVFFFLGLVWVSQSLKQRDSSWLRFGLGVVILGVVIRLMDVFRNMT